MIPDLGFIEVDAVEVNPMPSPTVKLYLSREDALRELSDNYVLVHQDHDAGAVSDVVGNLLVVLLDLGILWENVSVACERVGGEPTIDNESLGEIFGALSHEAYHLACRWMESIGEDDPAEEEMAYHVGEISAALYAQLLDYFDGTRG